MGVAASTSVGRGRHKGCAVVNIEASSLKKTKALYEISRIAAELTGSACHGPTDADVAGLSATWAELGMMGW